MTYEVPGDDLSTDTNGLVSSESELVLGSLDSLSVDLVSPTTVVSEDGSSLVNVESLGDGKGLSIVERLEGSENVDISLHQGSDLHEVLASLGSGAVGTPSSVECLVGGIKGDIDIRAETFRDLDEDLAGGRVVDAVLSAWHDD
jgi:hypothetical protein